MHYLLGYCNLDTLVTQLSDYINLKNTLLIKSN